VLPRPLGENYFFEGRQIKDERIGATIFARSRGDDTLMPHSSSTPTTDR